MGYHPLNYAQATSLESSSSAKFRSSLTTQNVLFSFVEGRSIVLITHVVKVENQYIELYLCS